MKIDIYGPNLDATACDLGDFHVHAAGCRGHRFPSWTQRSTHDCAAVRDVVDAIYDSIVMEQVHNGDYATEAESVAALAGTIHFAPCARTITRG